MAKTEKRKIGDWGEQQACSFLSNKGYQIIDRNYLTKIGEIDIIAYGDMPLFGRTLCFVEVKTRSGEIGSAERAVDHKKIDSLQKAARHYCLNKNIDIEKTPIQFEQVSVYFSGQEILNIEHYTIPVD
jgi:putative endonuclease